LSPTAMGLIDGLEQWFSNLKKKLRNGPLAIFLNASRFSDKININKREKTS